MLEGQWNMHGWVIEQFDLRRWSSAAIPLSFELHVIRMRDERLVAMLRRNVCWDVMCCGSDVRGY